MIMIYEQLKGILDFFEMNIKNLIKILLLDKYKNYW